ADIVGAFDVGARIVLRDPSVDVLDIEGDGLAQARDFFFQGLHGRSQQVGEQAASKLAQFLAQPEARGQGRLDIEAIRGSRVQVQLEAQFDDEQRVRCRRKSRRRVL